MSVQNFIQAVPVVQAEQDLGDCELTIHLHVPPNRVYIGITRVLSREHNTLQQYPSSSVRQSINIFIILALQVSVK